MTRGNDPVQRYCVRLQTSSLSDVLRELSEPAFSGLGNPEILTRASFVQHREGAGESRWSITLVVQAPESERQLVIQLACALTWLGPLEMTRLSP